MSTRCRIVGKVLTINSLVYNVVMMLIKQILDYFNKNKKELINIIILIIHNNFLLVSIKINGLYVIKVPISYDKDNYMIYEVL